MELPPQKRHRYFPLRWCILGLLFLAITVNYIDRLVISILAPDLQAKFVISDVQYGYIGSAFAIAYALGQIGAGETY